MEKTQKWGEGKIPVVEIDPALDEYAGKIMFPEKWERANAMLKTTKFPPKRTDEKPTATEGQQADR